MTYELWVLVWAAILGLVMIVLPLVFASTRKGFLVWSLSSRDTPFDKGVIGERLDRAFANFKQTFVFFAVTVILLALAHKSDTTTMWGVRLYLAARIIYIPLYAFNLIVLRTLCWAVSIAGIIMCLGALFH
ncbi:MAPEG family protein [Asticcacaulis sp. EMRT-3]|uniref:MAPEG family protein n=1 Tax=Asticcacaulis sp. EMRT-3 TaxID=3040349 RepID=UPI0024AFB8D2|nr:MAPEG family protein [Asticcacaulis sp. EMRT-3]MDI7774655.1 MAPEG family protein [Asticcacaulis sp. EMRT-3]